MGKDREKLQNSAGGKGYSLRALKRKEDADKKKESDMNLPGPTKQDSFGQSRSMLTLPHEQEYDKSVEMIDEMFGGPEYDDPRK